MITLVLGVNDVPYSANDNKVHSLENGKLVARKKRARRSNKPIKISAKAKTEKVEAGAVTTGDVAERLESQYGVMGMFVDLHKEDIARSIEQALDGAIDGLLMGAPLDANIFGKAESDIKVMFNNYLDQEEMAGLIKGVPTDAALKGINHRFKHPNTGVRRSSFIDTGLYEQSFVAEFKT